MNLKRGIPVEFESIQGRIFGGPFMKFEPATRRLVGIKMAEEIDHPHDFSVPTRDFSVPQYEDMVSGLIYSLDQMQRGKDTYVGCMGGIGRTGLFMGCMVKVMNDWSVLCGGKPIADPVAYVREMYVSHAIETKEQQAFVREFDSKPVLDWIVAALKPKVVFVEVSLWDRVKKYLNIN